MPLIYNREKAQQDIEDARAAYEVTQQEQNKGFLDTLKDFAMSDALSVGETRPDDETMEVIHNTNQFVANTISDINTANINRIAADISGEGQDEARAQLTYAPFKEAGREFINAYADDRKNSPVLSEWADSLRSSETAYNYIMNDDEKLAQARRIEQETGIPSSTILYDPKAWKNANEMYNNVLKQKEVYEEFGPGDWSLDKVYQLNPEIAKITATDPVSGALILSDMNNVKKEMSIIDTFNEYLDYGKMKLEFDNLAMKYANNKQSFDDMYRMQELQDKMNDFNQKHKINFADNPLAFAVSGAASSVPEMGQSIYAALEDAAAWAEAGIAAGGTAGSFVEPGGGTVVGGAVGGAVGGTAGILKGLLKAGSRAAAMKEARNVALAKMMPGRFGAGAQLGAFRGMADPEVGSRYYEYNNMKDANGKKLMTSDEAYTNAMIGGGANAALEIFPTFGVLGKASNGAKKQLTLIADAFKGAGEKYTGESIGRMAAKGLVTTQFKESFTESGEEALQTASDDLIMNSIESSHNDKFNGGVKSYKDITQDALEAFVASFPSSMLFGFIGALGAGTVGIGKYNAQRRSIEKQERLFGDQISNTAVGNALVTDLQEAVHDSKLKKTAPDVQKQLIKEKAAGTGFELVYVDTEIAMEKEHGEADLKAIAKANNMTDEDLQTAIDTKGTIAVPLECFAQADTSSNIMEATSYDTAAKPIGRMKKEIAENIKDMKDLMENGMANQKKMVDIIANEIFPAAENDAEGKAKQEMAKAIIMTFAENPSMGWNEMMKLVQSERMEVLQPALDYIKDTSGNGTVLIPIGDGKSIRVSENAQWYQNWYKEHGRSMTKADMEDLAEEMVRGKTNIGDYRGPAEEFAYTNDQLDEINGKIKALESIKDQMKELNGVEMKITEGLSKEGFSVYRAVYNKLKNAPGYASRAARVDAILFARHADLFAKIMRTKGHPEYTAKDYMAARGIQFGGEALGGFNQDGKSFDLNDKEAVAKFADGLKREDIPTINIDTELHQKLKASSNQKIFEWALEKVKSLTGKTFKDPLGNELYFKPGKTETLEDYALHIIAGMNNPIENIHIKRALGLSVIEDTITNPLAIITQTYRDENRVEDKNKPGRKMYISMFALDYQGITNVVVGVEEGQKGRIITSFVTVSKHGDKNKALSNFKNTLKAAYSVDYIKAGLSGYSRPATRSDASTRNIPLHISGKITISDAEKNVNSFPIVAGKSEDVNQFNQMAGEKSKRWFENREEKLSSVVENWNKLIADYNNNNIKEGSIYPVMKRPLVLSLLGVNYEDISIFGSFFMHSLRSQHSGMDEEVLRKIPEALVDPIMITEGNKPGSFVFTLAVENNDGSTVIVPLEINKIGNRKKAIVGNIINTAYGKDNGLPINAKPKYKWFIDQIEGGKVRYINIEKSTAWSVSIRGQFPVGDKLRNALSDFMLSPEFEKVKTEKDLEAEQLKWPTLYQTTRGNITPMSDGSRIIRLFETANESTFLHEMGHLFLMDLEDLAKIDEQSAKELAKVIEWAEYHKGDAKLYAGSRFAKEFADRANEIENALKHGDVERADQLKRVWMHERFARGFEMYLEFGEAPSAGLKSVFRKFKQFLRHIYIGFTGEGVRASAEVERIMARMIASDDEIEAAALSERYKDITTAGGEKLLNETEQETMKRWHDEAKEEAKEKLMAIIMKDLNEQKNREYQAKLDEERKNVTDFVESQPVYIAQKVIAETGNLQSVVDMGIFGSVEQLQAELDAVKALPADKVIEEHMADYAKELDAKMIDEHMSEENISKLMSQTHYHNKMLALEAAALQERTNSMQRISSKARSAIDEANIALDGIDEDTDMKLEKTSKPVQSVLKALNKLRFADRWESKDLENIDKIINSTTAADMREALKEFTLKSNEWKKNMKDIQESFNGRVRLIEQAAKQSLSTKTIKEACNYGLYTRNEKQSAKLMNTYIRLGKWEAAMRQQEHRMMSAAMAKYARKNAEHVAKLTEKARKQLKARTVKLPKDERYWHKQLGYLLRISDYKPEEPVDGVVQIGKLFEGLNESLDVQGVDYSELYNQIAKQDFAGYEALTVAQFEDAIDMMTVIYTTGRDKFRVKSFSGMMLDDVVEEIMWDDTGAAVMSQNRLINPDAGGIGYNDAVAKLPHIGEVLARAGRKYITAHIKPEELLKLIGEKAHKYIYGLYERAANEEGKKVAESVLKLQKILEVYSHAEKREWKKQKYTLETGAGIEKLSKENIICMALNRGNEVNWNRLFRGLRVNPNDLAKFIDENMTKKDWETVQNIWDYLDSYWEDTVRVEEKLNGITLKKTAKSPFWVKVDGENIKLEGGYYPIVYNPEKSSKAESQDIDKAAMRTMSGAQVLGTGRGFTKARSESMNIERPLSLSFDVIPEHVGAVIHNITYRIAARDVFRLTHNQKFEQLVRDTLGSEALRSINEWVVDCWRVMPNDNSYAGGMLNKALGFLRRNATFNIMGYRMWPVVENVTNIFPMMDKLGVANAIGALGDYYAHKKDNDSLILKSSFMSNRINSMDRDIKSMPGLFDEDMRGVGWMKQHAYSMMVFSDLMMSSPLWCRAYKDAIGKHYVEVEKENQKQVDDYKKAQNEVKRINEEMYDLVKRRNYILKALHPDEEEEYSPARMQRIGELNAELNEINAKLKPMEQEKFEQEKILDKLADVDLMLPSDILKEAEERAVGSADEAVRNVFGSGHVKDLAPIQKGSELAKMFTCFYSFFNTQANAILANYYKGKFAGQDLTGLQNITVWMPLAKSVLFRIILTSALATMLKMALTGDGSDDKSKFRKIKNDKGEEVKEEIPLLERFMKQFAKNTISTASGTMIGLREISSAVCSFIFDGTDFGGARFASVPQQFVDKCIKVFELANQKEERDARLAAEEEKRKARYDKMSAKQKKKFDEELQYRHPAKRITYADIAKQGMGAVTSVTAAKTGITDTMANTVMTTMQYMADGDGRYDPTLANIAWSAFWNKKPVEREIPDKPKSEKPEKKKKGAKK